MAAQREANKLQNALEMKCKTQRSTPLAAPTAGRLTLSTKRSPYFDSSSYTGQSADYIALPRVRLHSDRNFFRALPCKPWASACSEQALEIASLSALLILATDED